MTVTFLFASVVICVLARLVQGFNLSSISSCEDLDIYSSILVIAAHPDDIETIAGGTVSWFTQCHKTVQYLITTNGDKGWGKDTAMTSETLGPIREQEQLNAASMLGVENVSFLRQPDGRLDGVSMIDLKLNITKVIRTFKPDLVLTFSPETDYLTYQFGLMHEDHKLTGRVTMNALWPSARDYLNYYDELYMQGILPWICSEVWLFTFSSPGSGNNQGNYVAVDITPQYGNKLKALLQHESQYSDAEAVALNLKKIGRYVAANFAPQNDSEKLYEAFQRVNFL